MALEVSRSGGRSPRVGVLHCLGAGAGVRVEQAELTAGPGRDAAARGDRRQGPATGNVNPVTA